MPTLPPMGKQTRPNHRFSCRSPSRWILVLVAAAAIGAPAAADERVLDAQMHHIRCGDVREWSEFPPQAEADELAVEFDSDTAVATETTLRIRHRDVKQTWQLELNGKPLGRLPVDENLMVTYWAIPPSLIQAGVNRLRVHGSGKSSDDVLLGDLGWDDRPKALVLSEARLTVRVVDADNSHATPARITIVDSSGALVSTGATSDGKLAVRPGIVFTADGTATIPLPRGHYRIYAGRGFEYSVAEAAVELKPGETKSLELAIHREVPTAGYAACDTHCHTFTFSRHGDATIDERMVTLAAEGVEIPIATDHNVQVDYAEPAKRLGVGRYFTPITGNEVTTKFGHFNVFPLEPGPPSIDPTGTDWPTIFAAIRPGVAGRFVVLNHARDIHSGYRPFDPSRHIGPAGERLDDWNLEANLIEVVNSGTTQTDGLQLFQDWFGLLNRGLRIAPVGTSDSHDVARHFVGHARTYVRCDDRDAGAIPLDEFYQSLAAGRVLVSYGLLADLQIADRYSAGDLVPAATPLRVRLRVLGPHWATASKVTLYADGVPIREFKIDALSTGLPTGVKWEHEFTLERPGHDAFLAAIAVGPGIREPYWPTPKPYQPTSQEWTPYSLGATGAVMLDNDGDGRFTCPREYAERIVAATKGDFPALLKALGNYDEAAAIQAASLTAAAGQSLFADEVRTPLAEAPAHVRRGFQRYLEAWRESRTAQSSQ